MELDLKDYIKVLRKRIWLILSIVIISCIVTGVMSYLFLQPVYEASTELIVNSSTDRSSVGSEQLNINDINFNIRLIETYKEIIKTPYIMDKVVAEYDQLNFTSEQLTAKVKVSAVNNTQLMTLIVQDQSYDTAMTIVNAVSKVFQREIPTIMNVDNVSLLSEAKSNLNPVPVKPNPKLNIAISFVVALMTAMGLAFLLEYLDDTIKTEEDVQNYLGLPSLAMIMKVKEEDLRTNHFKVSKSKVLKGKVGGRRHDTTIQQ